MKSYSKPAMDIIEVQTEGSILDTSVFGIDSTTSVSGGMAKAPGAFDWDDEEEE